MQDAHLRDLDLNLLVVLDALVDTRSTTLAAARLGLTQSAVSHALRRLRDTLDDPLLVRAGRGLVPTARALELAEPLGRVLAEIRGLVAPTRFDPGSARGTVVVASTDFGHLLIAPGLAAALAAEAPGLDLRARPMPPSPAAALAAGDEDLLLDVSVPDAEGIYARALLDDGFVVLVRPGHPALGAPLDAARYAALRHVQISPRGRPGGAVDDALARLGLERRVAVSVASFLVAPFVVAETDAALTLPRRIADRVADRLGLVVLPLPVEMGRFAIRQVWHARRHADPAHRWLREVVARVAER